MNNDTAVFLDIDNLVIGAKQLNLSFDINLILEHINCVTGGRIVLRRAYGDWRLNKRLLEDLTAAGFSTIASMRLNNYSKNLADMQIVVDTMETLFGDQDYANYALITGDRDFTPLVQSLHKRGKQVVGVGMKYAASRSLVQLCDHYTFYEDLVPVPEMTEGQVGDLLAESLEELLRTQTRVRASILKQHMSSASSGALDNSPHVEGSFRKFLSKYPNLVELQQQATTTYVRRPQVQRHVRPLHQRYRSELKRKRMRVMPSAKRLTVLRDIINILQQNNDLRWRQLINKLSAAYQEQKRDISKNVINSVLLVAREGQVIRSMKGRSLASAPVHLQLEGTSAYQQAIIRCDAVYLRMILDLPEPFDLTEASLALYEDEKYCAYLENVLKKWLGE